MLLKKLFFSVIICGSYLTGCTTNSNFTIDPSITSISDINITQIVVENSSGDIIQDIDIEQEFKNLIENELETIDLTGDILVTLNVKIIQYTPGNAFARWVLPGLGETTLTVTASLINQGGQEVGWGQVSRSIGFGGGYTIGAHRTILAQVAKALLNELRS